MKTSAKNNSILAVMKFVLALLLFPIIWAMSVNFHQYVVELPGPWGEFFFWGMFGYLLFYLFFYQFWGVYELGQKIVAGAFQFMAPANHFVARVIPFFLTVILLLMCLVTKFFNTNIYDHYFMFFAGFAFTMHVILTASDLQHLEVTFVKPAYLYLMMAVTIWLIAVVVLLFDMVGDKFLFLSFIKSAAGDAAGIYYEISERVMFFK